MINNKAVLFLWAILLYMAIIYRSTALAMVSVFLVLFFLLSVVWQLYMWKKLQVKIRFPFLMIEKNQLSSFYLEVHNQRIFRQSRVDFLVEYRNRRGGRKRRLWVSAVEILPGKNTFRYGFWIGEGGTYSFRVKKMKIYDIFHLLYSVYSVSSEEKVLVLPEFKEIPLTLSGRVLQFYGEAEVFEQDRPGQDPSEIFDIREYQPGDKMSSIHWKTTAKMDQLMIKEHSFPKACAVLLMVNENGKKSDRWMEDVCSVSYTLMCHHCVHYLIWVSEGYQDIVRYRIDDEESFYEAIMVFLQDAGTREITNMVQEYQEKYRGEQRIYELLWEKGMLMVNGEVVVSPGNEKSLYEKGLELR